MGRSWAEVECISVQEIEITTTGIKAEGRALNGQECLDMAQADGFKTFSAMALWFWQNHHVTPFVGDLIKWRPYAS